MLSIVATPIGNLGDMTQRGIQALQSADAIVCEDTRVTGNLLKLLQLEKKELVSMHGYTDPEKVEWILGRLQKGEHLVLVSDAGTPGISDPGYALVSKAAEAGVKIEAIPGAAAFLTALSASGLPINQFLYLGFLPMKKGRKTLLESLKEEERTIVFYESVHRMEKTLDELAELLKDQPDRMIVIARELTKLHEEIVRVKVSELSDAAKKITMKGEFVIIIGGQ